MAPLALLAFFLYFLAFDLMFFLRARLKNLSKKDGIMRIVKSQNPQVDFNDLSSIKSAFSVLRNSIMPKTEQSLSLIGALAAAAPLLGLLGTVSGMTMALSGLQIESSGVADGVSCALITTQCGLTIAIPAFLIMMYCARMRQKILISVSKCESFLILKKGRNGA